MRCAAVLLLLAAALMAQDPWAIEAPKSKPKGKAIELKPALEPKSKQTLEIEAEWHPAGMFGLGGAVTALAMTLELGEKKETGEVPFEARYEITKQIVGPMDLSGMPKPPKEMVPRLRGRFGPSGEVVSGTLERSGGRASLSGGPFAGSLDTRMPGLLAWARPLVAKKARVGEAWKVDPEAVLARLGAAGLLGGKVEGQAYQVLEGIEKRRGVDCAKLRWIFSLTVRSDSMPVAGSGGGDKPPRGKGVLRLKGEGHTWRGLDGRLREGSLDLRLEKKARAGERKEETSGSFKIKITG